MIHDWKNRQAQQTPHDAEKIEAAGRRAARAWDRGYRGGPNPAARKPKSKSPTPAVPKPGDQRPWWLDKD